MRRRRRTNRSQTDGQAAERDFGGPPAPDLPGFAGYWKAEVYRKRVRIDGREGFRILWTARVLQGLGWVELVSLKATQDQARRMVAEFCHRALALPEVRVVEEAV